LDIVIWVGVFIGFVIACVHYNYKAGVEHGVDITLTTLENAGYIKVEDIQEDVLTKAVQNNKK